MIKKLLLSAICVFSLSALSFGQACVPDTQYTKKGIHPDTLVNFGPAYVNTAYSQLVTIIIPKDTVLPFLGAINWDSTVLASVSGLPASLSISCWNNSAKPNLCSWKGNTTGCAIITGTPVAGDIGTHNLTFNTINYLGGSSAPNAYAIKGYKIVVNPANSVNENPGIQVIAQNTPNPFNDKSEIEFISNDFGTANFQVYNMIGTVVKEYKISVKKGINKLVLDAADFDSGVYFYSLVSGSNVFTRRMIVKK